ncbi:MAG: T9SS type A sorting domain-containing protein [Bacteroidetes bacterium]|nr:T9SS type A sorting domain-containing protein [Bacteroidota bacterium]
MKKITFSVVLLGAGMVCSLFVNAQSVLPIQAPANAEGIIRCAQVQHDNYLRSQDPNFDAKRAEVEKSIQEGVKKIIQSKKDGNPQTFAQYTIPIVFHVVYNGAGQNVTDAKVQAAILQLNQDWSRTNSDAGNTPAPFQAVAVDMQIQFCLATKDPSGNPTTGIVHKSTTATSFTTNDFIKQSANGGDDPWDVTKYLNIWCGNLGGGLLGYGQFPPISSSYGTVVHYCTVGSLTNPGTCPPFGYGRTLSHEIGHCFNLYHIWGDDGGACTGDDLVADTPNQADATSGCYSFPHTDGCTPSGNGIMYMNYMDYSDDNCYNMFTAGQKARCQSAIANNLMSIANNAVIVCGPAAALDAGINSIVSPSGIACSTTLTPKVILQNYGATTLTSCTINYKVDANPNTQFSWTGSLASAASATVTLPNMVTTAGTHTFTSSTSNPNAGTDGNPGNDQNTSTFTVAGAAQNPPVVDGIESATFPAGWTLNNPDASATWTRTDSAKKTGSYSMYMGNYWYSASGQVDELTSNPISMQSATSAQLTFQVAYQLYTDPNAATNWSDTLKVQVSTDCGATWSTPYFKYSSNLTTVTPVFSTAEFFPTTSQWRLETVSLTPYLPASTMLVKFRHTNDYENNMYVDDINITSVVGIEETDINQYVSVYPNPSSGAVAVYINAGDLGQADVKITNVLGEVISQASENLSVQQKFSFDLSHQPQGMYFINVKTPAGSAVKKVMLSR